MKTETLQSTTSCDPSVMLAQLELFISLGSMPELDPNQHFAALLKLGNAIIAGEIRLIQDALRFYIDHIDIVFEHFEFLRRAFVNAGITIQEPSVLHYEGQFGTIRTAIVLSILLERAGKAAFICTDAHIASYVHSFKRNMSGTVYFAPAKEDPEILLKQLSRIIRMPAVSGPPPFSQALGETHVAVAV